MAKRYSELPVVTSLTPTDSMTVTVAFDDSYKSPLSALSNLALQNSSIIRLYSRIDGPAYVSGFLLNSGEISGLANAYLGQPNKNILISGKLYVGNDAILDGTMTITNSLIASGDNHFLGFEPVSQNDYEIFSPVHTKITGGLYVGRDLHIRNTARLTGLTSSGNVFAAGGITLSGGITGFNITANRILCFSNTVVSGNSEAVGDVNTVTSMTTSGGINVVVDADVGRRSQHFWTIVSGTATAKANCDANMDLYVGGDLILSGSISSPVDELVIQNLHFLGLTKFEYLHISGDLYENQGGQADFLQGINLSGSGVISGNLITRDELTIGEKLHVGGAATSSGSVLLLAGTGIELRGGHFYPPNVFLNNELAYGIVEFDNSLFATYIHLDARGIAYPEDQKKPAIWPIYKGAQIGDYFWLRGATAVGASYLYKSWSYEKIVGAYHLTGFVYSSHHSKNMMGTTGNITPGYGNPTNTVYPASTLPNQTLHSYGVDRVMRVGNKSENITKFWFDDSVNVTYIYGNFVANNYHISIENVSSSYELRPMITSQNKDFFRVICYDPSNIARYPDRMLFRCMSL